MKLSESFPRPEHPWLRQIEGPLYEQIYPMKSTDEQLVSMMEEIERLVLRLHMPYGFVVHIPGFLNATSRQRRIFANYEKRISGHESQYCAGNAIIVPTRLARGIVTAVFWLSPPVYPVRLFAKAEDGEIWLRQELIKRRVEIGIQPRPRNATWAV